MANSLGALIVRLGLDGAEFTRGLSKAEYQTQQFARNVNSAILQVGKVLGGLEIGRELFNQTKEIIESAAALNDLADATGSSVEALSRLNNQAKISGTDFATFQSLLLKMSAGMAGMDDESTKAKEALALLGVTSRDPAEALNEVAVKLNTYADGVNKAGLAVALFGKQGPAFLATLKDIAELQDVGATISAKQAAEAEALGKEYRRLGVEATAFSNIILSGLVPQLRDAISEMTTATRVAGDFGGALRLLAGVDLGRMPQELRKINAEIERLQGEKTTGGLFSAFNNDQVDKSIANLEKAKLFIREMTKARALALIDPSNNDSRDIRAQAKPPAPFISNAKESKAAADRISDADRYAESLARTLQGTLELSAEETALAEIYKLRQDVQSGLTAETEKTILDYARQIDAAHELAKAKQEEARAEQEASRIRERNSQMQTREIENAQREAQQMREANGAIEEQIAFLKGGEAGLRAYTDAKLAKAVAELQDKEAMLINAGASQQLIDSIHEQTKALQDRQNLTGDVRLAEQFKKDAQALQDVKNMLADSFANAFSDFISGTKSAKDAFKSFADDIVRQITRIAAQNLANSVFGGNSSSGSDFFGVLGKLFGGFSGSSTGGSSVGFSGGGFGEHFAMGGVSSGGLAMVGEHGPEVVKLPRGAEVTPNHKLSGMWGYRPGEIHQNINVLPGANYQTARQAGKMAADKAMFTRRRG